MTTHILTTTDLSAITVQDISALTTEQMVAISGAGLLNTSMNTNGAITGIHTHHNTISGLNLNSRFTTSQENEYICKIQLDDFLWDREKGELVFKSTNNLNAYPISFYSRVICVVNHKSNKEVLYVVVDEDDPHFNDKNYTYYKATSKTNKANYLKMPHKISNHSK